MGTNKNSTMGVLVCEGGPGNAIYKYGDRSTAWFFIQPHTSTSPQQQPPNPDMARQLAR
jgi:hypothetical protein